MKTFLRIGLLLGLAGVSACLGYSAPAPGSAKLTFRRVFNPAPRNCSNYRAAGFDAATHEIRQLDEDAGASPFRWARHCARRC